MTATIAVYAQVASHPFTYYDDQDYVMNNSHIQRGLDWESVKWSSTTFTSGNWHPLTWLSHIVDYGLFGRSAAGPHVVNLVLHVVNALLLFWVLWRSTDRQGRSLMVAALFALHPINVESVAWVAERKNLLSMCFFLLGLGVYRWYVLRPTTKRYGLVAIFYACGLMAKPQVITFPLVLLLWDYWPLRRMALHPGNSAQETALRRLLSLVREKIPLLAFSAASAIVTVKAQAAGGAVSHPAWHLRLENAIVSYAAYLVKAVWPIRLAPIYIYPQSLNTVRVLASLAVLLAVTALVWRERRRGYLPVGWLWFLGTLVPMIGLVQVGRQAMADRYAYLPFVGLFLMVCWGACDLLTKLPMPRGAHHWRAGAEAALGIAALLPLAILTHTQVGRWRSNVGLWQYTLAVTGGNYVAEGNLGVALEKEGKPIDAMPHFFKAVALYPSDPTGNIEIAMYYQRMGMLPEAIAQDKKVLALPLSPEIRGEILSNLGFSYGAIGQYELARQSFLQAVISNPHHSRAWMGLGVVTQRAGDASAAVADYSHSIQEAPSDVTYLLLSRALEEVGRRDEARAALAHASLLSSNLEQAKRTADQLLAP